MTQDKPSGKHRDHPNVREFIRLREQVGWPISQIADRLRVDRTAVYRWVAGDMVPHESRLAYFASMIGEPMQLGSERLLEAAAPRVLDDWEKDFLDTLRPIPPKERRRLMESLSDVVRVLRTPLDYGKPRKKKAPVSSPEVAAVVDAGAQKVVGSIAPLAVADGTASPGAEKRAPAPPAAEQPLHTVQESKPKQTPRKLS